MKRVTIKEVNGPGKHSNFNASYLKKSQTEQSVNCGLQITGQAEIDIASMPR